MSLLSIVTNAIDEIGLPSTTFVVGNNDQTIRILLSLLNREGKNLVKLRNGWGGSWTILEREHSFTTVATQDEYDLPGDFGELIGDSAWDRTSFFQVRGELGPQEWQQIRSGLSVRPAFRKGYRIRRSLTSASRKFTIDPVPTAGGETLIFEYVSKNWVSNTAGSTFSTAFAADDDLSLFDEDLLEMGLVWRFKSSKGLSFATDIAVYEQQRDQRLANDTGTKKIFLVRRGFRLPPGNTPETGFGV